MEPEESKEAFTIISRFEWSGTNVQVYRTRGVLKRPAPLVYASATYTEPCYDSLYCGGSLRLMQRKHFSMFPTDIRFNFMVGGDGRVYEGRGWSVPPRLSGRIAGDIMKSILIGFIGMYKEDHLPAVMIDAASDLIDFGKRNKHIDYNCTFKSVMDFRTENN